MLANVARTERLLQFSQRLTFLPTEKKWRGRHRLNRGVKSGNHSNIEKWSQLFSLVIPGFPLIGGHERAAVALKDYLWLFCLNPLGSGLCQPMDLEAPSPLFILHILFFPDMCARTRGTPKQTELVEYFSHASCSLKSLYYGEKKWIQEKG